MVRIRAVTSVFVIMCLNDFLELRPTFWIDSVIKLFKEVPEGSKAQRHYLLVEAKFSYVLRQSFLKIDTRQDLALF